MQQTSKGSIGPRDKLGAPAPAARAFARWITRYRLLVVLAWLIAAVLVAAGGDRIRTDPDVLVYFDPAKPERQAFDAVEARFGQAREVVSLVVPDRGDVFAPRYLRTLADLEVRSLARPEVAAVRSPLGETGLSAAAVLAADDATLANAAARLKEAANRGDGAIAAVIPQDGSVAAVAAIVPAALGNASSRQIAAAHAALRDAVAKNLPGADILQTGRIPIDDAFLRESQEGVENYALAQIGVLSAILVLALGSVTLAATVIALVMVTLTGSTGTLGWLGITVNGISSTAPVVLMGLVVATAIHVAMAWQEALRSGATRIDALALAIDRNAKPVVLSVVTTLVSFLTLNLAEAPPFRDLGNIVAVGLIGVLALTFTLLPALLALVPQSFGRHRRVLEQALGALGAGAARHRRSVILGGFAAFLAGGAGIWSIKVDDTFSHYFDQRYEIRRATDLFETKLSGTTIIDLVVDAGAPGAAFTPEALDRLAAVDRWLGARPEVARVDSLAALRTDTEARGAPPSPNILASAAAQMVEAGAPRLAGADGREVRTSVVLRGVSSRQTLAFADALRTEAATLFGPASVTVTGLPILSAQLSLGSARAMVVGIVVALVAISLILFLTLRDWRLGLVSLLPNVLPVMLAFGIWGFLVGEISFAATVVAALTYGLVVDDTVHLLAKYQRYGREIGPGPEALRRAFRSVGVAVVATSLALGASFMPFAMSGFLVNRHFGALTAITLIAAMVADLVLLPAFLARKSWRAGR
ncbi:efflux RND transporter permease subunit [Acuticoccus sp. MNP-M23]|uniref:efflux RND transporter permease subunit n=1 Tax=Acuticoccus sp. MNP-M23 TaxID=3072793 RepID=UPI002814ECDB|nr:efflux RND transporter permease subunit [Acuticoccus sp. MNP-M23]WMS43347.1 efflux RND transporter permease subunit [Acuticoccus sp. MNP-M23]